MEFDDLIHLTYSLSIKARLAFTDGNVCKAQLYLVQLRELLNEQPMLEAGGSYEASEPSDGI